ncbi:Abhydrolase family protein [Paenibacillus sp. 1_12]|uniref:dienelactone hydrolase family protein n=1 Tax=Paenibacillus sp. 1_12 TaxID=1566278 RepID=UPI0008E88B5A|nr:alpha/beta hydrolase family protein [Paenibacillus sp. 1_12]SFK97943.1 Abhydrolase family protein [Paenibacillus sp. 1_12]
MWNPDEFLEQLYASQTYRHTFKAHTQAEWSEWRAALKERLIQALVLPQRGTVPLNPVSLERVDCGEYIREHIELTTDRYLTMPCYVLIPKHVTPQAGEGTVPAIVACPGHGYGYKQLIGLMPDGSDREDEVGIYKDYPIELVKRGFIVIVPELLGLGDRRLLQDQDKEPNANSCFRLSTNLLMAGKTLAGYRVHEMMCCIDYLLSLNEVAPQRIGCMGFSGGGLVMALTAAIDERIQAAVISGYTNTYGDSILAKPHCSDNYIPDMLNIAEMPDIWGLIAPRPLLIESGEFDLGFPIAGTIKALNHLKSIYHVLDAEEQLEEDIHPGKHEISGAKAYDWLHRHLSAQ